MNESHAAPVPAAAPWIARAAPSAARLPAILVAAMAALVLIGWLFHLDPLGGPLFSGTTMKANTALGLMLLSLALLARLSPLPRMNQLSTAGALVLAVLSLSTAAEYAFSADLGIDQLLARDSSAIPHPGRMSILTDVSLGLMAAALLSWNVKTRSHVWVAHVLLFVTAAIAFGATLFHLYGVSGVEMIANSADMAPHTALAFLTLVAAAFAARIDRGLAAAICSDTDAARSARRFLVIAVFALIGFGYVRLAGERAGFYSTAVGLALMVNLNVLVFVALILWRTRTLIRAEAERRQIAEDLQTVMTVMPAGIGIAHDPECARITGNPYFGQMVGLPPGTNMSKNATSGTARSYRVMRGGQEVPPSQLPMQVAAREQRTVLDWEADIVRNDGTVITTLGNAAPLLDAQKRVRGSVGSFLDITERRGAEMERERLLAREQSARAEAEAAIRSKDEFLATLSHELRTPLNAVLGWLRLLRSGKLTPARQEHALETIERNAAAELMLVEDLLDLSGVTTGRLQLDIRPVDLPAMAESALDAMRPSAQAKRIDLRLHAQPALRPCAGDARRLQQVFLNLISNAVKFTPEGGSVEVTLGYAGDTAQITVTDTGRGISPEFLPHVFDRFRQEDTSATRQHAGVGLGLAIVRHLVELHAGSVTVESRGRGLGARFVVTLPLVAATAADRSAVLQRRSAAAKAGQPVHVPLHGIHVLVVQRDPDGRAVLVVILQQRGAAVTEAAPGDEALEAVRLRRPDVIVADADAPGGDAFVLVQRLRREPDAAIRSIPAIAVTAYARSEDRTAALAAGFQAHLAKPVNEAELCATVAAFGRLAQRDEVVRRADART